VVALDLYENDLVVRRTGSAPDVHDKTRSEITTFSKASRRRLAFVASNTTIVFTTLITLTYPGSFPSDGNKVRRDRKAFLDWLRREAPGCEYLWFLEFQKRGAPHFHVLHDYPWPTTRREVTELRFRVDSTWYRIVGSGDPRHLAAGCRTEKLRSSRGGAHYAVKYASKMRQKVVPPGYRNVGRFWGHSRGVRPESQGTLKIDEASLRVLLQGWEFAPAEDVPIYKVLYNARDILRATTDLWAELAESQES
jgi:hypothetical protein